MQAITGVADHLADVVVCLDATLDTLTTMKERCIKTMGKEKGEDALGFVCKEMLKDVVCLKMKAEGLVFEAGKVRALVSGCFEICELGMC